MKSGIYCIKSILTNKIYIGQSVYLKRRLQNHKKCLQKGNHGNEILQRHYTKYGEEDLVFEIIEFCSVEMLDEKERFWISFYNSLNRKNGFNMESGGNKGKCFSEERIAKITGNGNPMYGKTHSNEFKKYIQIKNRASSNKLNEEDVKKIKLSLLHGEKQNQIAENYNIDITTVNKIARCKNWEWVMPELNEKLISITIYEKNKRNEEFLQLFKEGFSIKKIASLTSHQHLTVTNALKDELVNKKTKKIKLERDVLKDYEYGLNRTEIMQKHNITVKVYQRIIGDKAKEKKEQFKNDILKLKKSGMMNNQIAKKLNIHRTTVTECLKKFYPESLKKYTK